MRHVAAPPLLSHYFVPFSYTFSSRSRPGVASGFIDTDMTKALKEEWADKLKAQIPAGRMGPTLLSDHSFMTLAALIPNPSLEIVWLIKYKALNGMNMVMRKRVP